MSDTSTGRVGVVDLSRQSPVWKAFVRPSETREAGGLAIDWKGVLWVGDHKKGKVFQLSSDGRLIKTFP